MSLFVEPTLSGFKHFCTPQDVVEVLKLLEQEHLEQIEVFVLRQPSKNEQSLCPVWGRFIYFADLGRYAGPGVYLEAMELNGIIKWPNSLNSYERRELQTLAREGHKIHQRKRGYEIITSPEGIRNTQLFRTLPHEFGHAVDFLFNAIQPASTASNQDEAEFIYEKFRSKPKQDKEEFADRYAKDFYKQSSKKGSVPFRQRWDKSSLIEQGLDPEWFHKLEN